MPNYDPYTHAHALGVDIIWGTPGQGILGRYDHASRTIILREGMLTRQERSVLAHELVHATRGDEHDAWDALYSARRERACDLKAAENLIDPVILRRAAAFYPDNLSALAYELDVTAELLAIYLDAHPFTAAHAYHTCPGLGTLHPVLSSSRVEDISSKEGIFFAAQAKYPLLTGSGSLAHTSSRI